MRGCAVLYLPRQSHGPESRLCRWQTRQRREPLRIAAGASQRKCSQAVGPKDIGLGQGREKMGRARSRIKRTWSVKSMVVVSRCTASLAGRRGATARVESA